MTGYVTEDSREVYDGRLARVRIDRVRMPDGGVAEREIVEHPRAVAVVPVDGEGRVVLIRHYRQPLGERLLEIPAGILDVPGETPRDAASRELREEVGLDAGELAELGTFANSAGWTDETTTLYLGTRLSDATAEGFTPEAEEAHIEVVRLPLGEAVAMAERGEVPDAKTLVGLLLAARRLDGSSAGGGPSVDSP